MADRSNDAAQDRWPAVSAARLFALVRARATFIDGKLAERRGQNAEPGTFDYLRADVIL
jgi:hypothetical protein